MKLLVLATLLVGTLAAPMQQSLSVNDDGSYQFYYETGKDGGQHSRSEVRHPDGVVIGKYSYEDANGDVREVNYRADDSGYVANGDVSVEGAPKGQFPVPVEEEQKDEPPPEPNAEEPEPKEPAAEEPKPEEPPQDEDQKENDKDLSLDEPSPDDPPEAFPLGFFGNLHGLRRLPEPTPEEKPTSESPIEEPKEEVPSEEENEAHPEEQPSSSAEKVEEQNKFNEKVVNEMEALMHLRPFQSFQPQPVDTSMFRPPVYVFSYQHPDSYGYHYFF